MKDNIIQNVFNWAVSGEGSFLTPENYCATRDVFQARLEKLIPEFSSFFGNENLAFLLIAVAGEIGNNSFDHNLGSWRDTPGVFFGVHWQDKSMVLADRGQGILKTISKAVPDLRDEAKALKIAFTQTISGRFPEQRGNGLKFVSKVIRQNNWRLEFFSGSHSYFISSSDNQIKKEEKEIPGVLAIIKF